MAAPGSSASGTKCLLELPADVKPATQVRSALLQSSLSAIDRLGLSEQYFAKLSQEDANALRSLVVGQWNPMSLALTHYGAIDSLGISPKQAKANGRIVAEKVQGGFAGIVFRGLGTAVSPLHALVRAPTFFARLVEGGAVGLEQRGPKDARIEVIGIPIGRYDYVREGWAGMFEATLGLLTYKTFVRNSSPRGGERVILDFSWV